ncbi:hypothetical protein IPV09_03970 [Tessaracoccus sp. SD287]|uniref:hypothetical protein n=1 Tax=Tessaracoccus sp. SD287 TaxID=2782008 RepID=UPI001A97D030|nr:hypothetical protein [Tessaracoccus sp. SD287]MBO1030488.1 hypothetical protein [Tessaracoccus sp. SD287]
MFAEVPMSYPPHNPQSPGQQQPWGPQPWGQQPPVHQPPVQQPWVQQPGHDPSGGWGSQYAQSWAPSPAPKKSSTGLVAILVAVAILIAGVGIWAVTATGRNKAEPAVREFFELLNTPKPSYSEFSKHVAGIDFRNVYDATRHSPGGTWSLVSVGKVTDDTVPVTYKHNEQEFTADFAVRQEDNKTKLYKPFTYVTFSAEERLRFVLGSNDDIGVFLDQQIALFPGSYTITPLPSYTGDAPTWQPSEPTLDMLPGAIKTITLQPRLTDDHAASTSKAVTDAFTTCLQSDSFYPVSCPFRSTRPADADFPAQVVWSITPADAPSKPVLDENSGVLNPCYQVRGMMAYTYATRTGGSNQSTQTQVTATGCVRTSLGTTRVTWKR